MPSFTSRTQNLRENGPIIQVNIGLAKPIREKYQKENKRIPIPLKVNGLIDTGATVTFVSPRVPRELNLTPHGVINIYTASQPAPANVYDVYLDLVSQMRAPVVFDPIRVAEAPLIGQSNIDCLIGRDILSKGLFLYIGYADTFSFSL